MRPQPEQLTLSNWFDLDLPPATSPAMRQAQDELTEAAVRGTRCPCCGRLAKVYSERLHSGMARTMVWIVQAHEERMRTTSSTEPIWLEPQRQAPRFVLRSRKLGRLAHWGLVEQREHDGEPSRKVSGQWRPTPLGYDFVNGEARVPARIFLFNNSKVGASDLQVDIVAALGTAFDYHELMNATPEIRHG